MSLVKKRKKTSLNPIFTSVVIVDDGKTRGFLAPAEDISREDLEEMLEIFELSSPEYRKKVESWSKEADEKNLWKKGDDFFAEVLATK